MSLKMRDGVSALFSFDCTYSMLDTFCQFGSFQMRSTILLRSKLFEDPFFIDQSAEVVVDPQFDVCDTSHVEALQGTRSTAKASFLLICLARVRCDHLPARIRVLPSSTKQTAPKPSSLLSVNKVADTLLVVVFVCNIGGEARMSLFHVILFPSLHSKCSLCPRGVYHKAAG